MNTAQMVTLLRAALGDQEFRAPDGSRGDAARLATAKKAFAELDRALAHGAGVPYQWNPRLRDGDETEVEIEYWRGR